MLFIVFLPKHDYRQEYNYDEFIQLFPNSLITLALQSHELIIPIDNPLVKPEILKLLHTILIETQYPYIDDSSGIIRKSLDYLGIDLPDFVYNPLYAKFLQSHPHINLFNLDDLNKEYTSILVIAREMKFPSIVDYLFSMTKPHIEQDITAFNEILCGRVYSESNEAIAVLILQKRDISEEVMAHIRAYMISFITLGYVNVVKILKDKYQVIPPSNSVMMVMNKIYRDPEHTFQYINMINYLLPIKTSDEYKGILIYSIIYQYITTGDIKILDSLFEENQEVWLSLGEINSYLWIINHYERVDILNHFIGHITNSNIRNHTSVDLIQEFFCNYLLHPTVIKPNILRSLGMYIKNRHDGEYDMLVIIHNQRAIEQLQSEYPQFACILKNL